MDAGLKLGQGVYSSRLAARLGSISVRQLRYWGSQNLVRASVYDAPRHGRDLYSYTDLVQVRVVARLRQDGASLQKIRKAVDWLREVLETDTEWHTKTLKTDGRTIFAFLGPDEVYHAVGPQGQRVFHVNLQEIEQDLREIGRELGIGDRVNINPAVQGGTPVVRNTRLPTSFLYQLLREGESPEEIISHYPNLEAADIEAAQQFEEKLRLAS